MPLFPSEIGGPPAYLTDDFEGRCKAVIGPWRGHRPVIRNRLLVHSRIRRVNGKDRRLFEKGSERAQHAGRRAEAGTGSGRRVGLASRRKVNASNNIHAHQNCVRDSEWSANITI